MQVANRHKTVEVQLCFGFLLPPHAAVTPEEIPQVIHLKCRNAHCEKAAADGKAYCSKAHSPFGNLQDEPDNSPIEWFAPEGSQWMQDKAFF
jgi:hypothetical protein